MASHDRPTIKQMYDFCSAAWNTSPLFHGTSHFCMASMSSDQTKTAILTAAEMLWAERSFGEVTMRDIVAAAGVNLAAVNYHFGSKDELLAELFVSRTTVLNRERFAELKDAELEGGGKASVDAI